MPPFIDAREKEDAGLGPACCVYNWTFDGFVLCRVAGRRVDVGVLQVYKTDRGFCSLRERLIPLACGDIGVSWTLIRDQLSGLHKNGQINRT